MTVARRRNAISLVGPCLALLLAAPRVLAADRESTVELGLGLQALGGIAVLDAPTPKSFTLPASGRTAEQGALSGFVFGGGFFVEARAFEIIALELGPYYGRDRMSGQLRVNGQNVVVDAGQGSVHVPILIKGLLPWRPAAPFLVFGPEFVVPTLPSAESDPARVVPVAATAETYWNLIAGVGAELRLPVENVDLRLPLSLRVGYKPAFGDALDNRVRVLISDALIYTSTPRYSIQAAIGIGWFL